MVPGAPDLSGSLVPGAAPIASWILDLQAADPRVRESAAAGIFHEGCTLAREAVSLWMEDAQFRDCLRMTDPSFPEMIVGVAVDPDCFEKIRAAMGMPHLADVPPDLDAREFELEFSRGVRLDVLTTKEPGGTGAIARYLQKSGAGIQQIEILSKDVERATEILRTHFGLNPLYPAARAGAGGTRVNFFLVPAGPGKKALIEIVQDTDRI